MKNMRLAGLSFLFLLTASFAAQARFIGTMILAYGPAGQDKITVYYVYQLYTNLSLDGDKIAEKLKKETPALTFKRHELYFMEPLSAARPQFEATLTAAERNSITGVIGGAVDSEGADVGPANGLTELLSPQHPQPSSGKATPTATTQTTASGVQYSTADMSMFTKDARNGTIALYYGSGGVISTAYIYELMGPNTDDKSGIANLLAKRVSASQPFIGFEQRAGNCATAETAIRQKAGNSVNTRCQGEYRAAR